MPSASLAAPSIWGTLCGRAPLSHAVAMEGHIEVQEPFDFHFGHNMFTDEGREMLNKLCTDEFLEAEHWAPECKLFSKARASPSLSEDGRCQGPSQ